MSRRTIWAQTVVRTDTVAEFLSQHNFQAGKFHIVWHSPIEVLVVYVRKEAQL